MAFLVGQHGGGGGGGPSFCYSTRMPITTAISPQTPILRQRLYHQSQAITSSLQLHPSSHSWQQQQYHGQRSSNNKNNNDSARDSRLMTYRHTMLFMNDNDAAAEGSGDINGLRKNSATENNNGSNSKNNRDPFEQQINDLSKEWRSLPSQEVEDRLLKLETELRWEIATLTKKLKLAEAQRMKDKELQDMMRFERQALEREISKAKRDSTVATTNWKTKQEEAAARKKEEERYKALYEQELQTRQSQQEEARLEIKRLQEEVRIVFSVGRRTSDKLVENLTLRLEDSEEQLQATLDDLASKEELIVQLKQERESLRKLGRLSIRLAWQRLRYRLRLLRYKLLPLPPLNPNSSSSNKNNEDDKVRVGGRRMKKRRRQQQRSSGVEGES